MMDNLQHDIREFISVYTEKPIDVLNEVTSFMEAVIRRSSYVIFQSEFGFMDDDIPFTMVVQREDNDDVIPTWNIEWWYNDWCTFKIMQDDLTHIAGEWEPSSCIQRDIPDWKNFTARQIIEHPECSDSRYTYTLKADGEDSGTLFTAIQSALIEVYGCDDVGYNPKTSGVVAVIYRES